MDQYTMGLVIGTALLAAVLYAVVSLFRGGSESSAAAAAQQKKDKSDESVPSSGGVSKKKVQAGKAKKPTVSSHPLLAAELKGHTAAVTGVEFDLSGDYLASCSDDRTIRIWYSKDFSEREHRYYRINVDLDQANQVRFSPDSRALVTLLDSAQIVRVLKLSRKKDATVTGSSTALDIGDATSRHPSPYINVAISSTGKFIMTMRRDCQLNVWSTKGDILETLDTRQMTAHFADISPDGRFIACCGFVPDVKLLEVKFKSGEFVGLSRAMELTGHTSSVYHFSFSADSTRVVTISKDGSWKLWDIDVNYQLKQDPRLVTSHQHCTSPSPASMLSAISPDKTTVAVAQSGNVTLYSADDGNVHQTLGSVHAGDITSLQFNPSSDLLCSAGLDKRINIWHNVVGVRANVESLRAKIKTTRNNELLKERLQSQLSELEATLAQLTE